MPRKKKCPECGKLFKSLGSHRRNAHGVAGQSRTPATKEPSGLAQAKRHLKMTLVVQSVWPRGIQTRDETQLTADLHLLNELQQRVR